MELVFVHGYSVRNTATYGELPSRLEQELARRGLEVRVDHIYLGKYVSFNDSVTLDDLSRAFDAAVQFIGATDACSPGRPFRCVYRGASASCKASVTPSSKAP